jgi:hypothetical protein
MLGFKKCIFVERDFSPEFVCNKICRGGGLRYFISVLDRDRNALFFTMELSGGIWKIKNSRVPPWITDVEILLEAAIRENLTQ